MRSLSAVAAAVSVVALVGACTSSSSGDSSPGEPPPQQQSPGQVAGVALPDNAVDNAIGKLDGLAQSLLDESGIPGMAVAVVHGGKTVYAKGFGVREVGKPDKVDTGTVFQLASVSKSVGATVVAPWFALSDPAVTPMVTVGDMFAHRSGLHDHAGDLLEDLGYDRRQV